MNSEDTNSTTDKRLPSHETHLDDQTFVKTAPENYINIQSEQASRTSYVNPISSSSISVHDNNSPIPHSATVNTAKELKQSELRQREQKIRKRENELKIRKRIIEESQTERTWFKTYINLIGTKSEGTRAIK